MTSIMQYLTANREDLGTSMSFSVVIQNKSQNGRTFHSFHEEEVGNLLPKNMARTARRHLDGRHLLFGEYPQK